MKSALSILGFIIYDIWLFWINDFWMLSLLAVLTAALYSLW